ncbi:UDP-glycosyltransferase family protein [Sesbania bispinosa]|nr:UDP-glycosyltransferase family protein [Sesbania bispinosa]
MGWQHLISHWRSAFSRASVVVFPDFTYPMLYSELDTGNFFVIHGSPVDVWAAETYSKTHTKDQLRELSGFGKNDMVVLVVGSSIFYDDLSWDYAVAMHSIGPLLTKYARRNDASESFKFVFLCGNSTDGYDDALQEDIAGGSSSKSGKLSKFAQAIGSSGRQLAKNVLALDCITGYARLLENVLNFPSDALLPGPVSQIQQGAWEWNLFPNDIELDIELPKMGDDFSNGKGTIVHAVEHELASLNYSVSILENGTEVPMLDKPSKSDWDILREIEISEENEMLEIEEVEERMEKDVGVWDEIYRNARKSEKLKFEANERDEGELERTGQPVCIYEIYSGAGVWPFLHHGSLYRGLSLSRRSQRQSSDDVDAVGRLPLLNDTFYRDILCEMGGMFAIANRVDSIHRRPWIGFQSWRAAGRQVALSAEAERALEETMQENFRGDVLYFWGRLDMDGSVIGSNNALTFWSMCDILNGGNCRTVFQDGFRQMYALPPHAEALPPMPEDGGYWSALHSWVMPTPSFLEFVMFSRMFVDSVDALHKDSSKYSMCLLGSSEIEKKHCYCRVLELLINVWAYHSARKMVYINPNTGSMEEQHPIEQRKGFMWAKYFNITLLKSMDEDLAEAADDGDHPREMWLWPMTGEVHWQGIYEREREESLRKVGTESKGVSHLLLLTSFGPFFMVNYSSIEDIGSSISECTHIAYRNSFINYI